MTIAVLPCSGTGVLLGWYLPLALGPSPRSCLQWTLRSFGKKNNGHNCCRWSSDRFLVHCFKLLPPYCLCCNHGWITTVALFGSWETGDWQRAYLALQ